jgi:cell division protein FtsB
MYTRQKDFYFKKQNNFKLKLVLFLFLVWITWISGIFGNNGLLQAYRLSKVRYELLQRVEALELENQALQVKLEKLKNDSVTQEKTIRQVLGYVRPNELIFEFHD